MRRRAQASLLREGVNLEASLRAVRRTHRGAFVAAQRKPSPDKMGIGTS
jgi:hypothetical protein